MAGVLDYLMRLLASLPRESQRVPVANALEYQQFRELYGRDPRQGELATQQVAPGSYVAGQIAGTNVAGGAPGPRFGSAAQYRVPMRLQQYVPGAAKEGGDAATYVFRNRLGATPMQGQAAMSLYPDEGRAIIEMLGTSNPAAYAAHRAGGFAGGSRAHYGGTAEGLKEMVGRLVEDLVGAGYTKFQSSPISKSRGRLFERIAGKLEQEGKIPAPKGTVQYGQDVAEAGVESRAIANARARRSAQAAEAGDVNQVAQQYLDQLQRDGFM